MQKVFLIGNSLVPFEAGHIPIYYLLSKCMANIFVAVVFVKIFDGVSSLGHVADDRIIIVQL